MHDLLGPGIFNSDGELWRIQRKTAANIFSVKHFKHFVSEVFTTEMDRLTIQLQKFADQGNVVDLQELMFKFTLDGFCKIGFHVIFKINFHLFRLNWKVSLVKNLFHSH